jgi:nucleoside-diphosphate-sugar epimerase
MKILITGSEGFVGRHFKNRLLNEGHIITCIDINHSDFPNDCRNFFKTCTTRYDLVIHLAAIVGGREVIEREPLKVAVDLSIDAEFFQFVMRTKPKKIVYFSSSAAYPVEYQDGEPGFELYENLIDLNDIHSPDMTYGLAKIAGEYQASFIEDSEVYIFRPFSGYGEDQDLTYPFPSFIKRAIRKDNPFVIWGDGTQVRDFIHIDDIVEAVMVAVKNSLTGTYNLGTGRAMSFNRLAKKVCDQVGYEPEYNWLLEKPVGVQYRVASIARMNKFYTAKISIEEGIERAIRAYS